MRNGFGGDPSTPARAGAGSPSTMPGSVQKIVKGLSFTQLYSQYTEMASQLEAESRRTAKLSAALDGMMQDAEAYRANIEEQQAEYLRERVGATRFSLPQLRLPESKKLALAAPESLTPVRETVAEPRKTVVPDTRPGPVIADRGVMPAPARAIGTGAATTVHNEGDLP